MLYFGYKFVIFFVELPTFDCKICLFSLEIIPFYCPKTKFKHTLRILGSYILTMVQFAPEPLAQFAPEYSVHTNFLKT